MMRGAVPACVTVKSPNATRKNRKSTAVAAAVSRWLTARLDHLQLKLGEVHYEHPVADSVLTDDERAISTRHLGFTVSPHEECGAEEAVRLVERHGGSSTVLTLGPPEAEEQLRDMMAIGVDQALHLVTDGSE